MTNFLVYKTISFNIYGNLGKDIKQSLASSCFDRLQSLLCQIPVFVVGRNATCDHGDVRLYGGYSKSDGLAEICINGKWTKICYHGGNEIIGIKFCRQLLGRENVGMYA